MKIYKYPLEWCEAQALHTPAIMEPLSLQIQCGVPTLWAKVDETTESKARHVYMLPTGAMLPETDNLYLGTLQTDQLVFHFCLEVQP